MKNFFELSIEITVVLFILITIMVVVSRIVFSIFPNLKESWLFKPNFIRNLMIYHLIGLSLLGIVITASFNNFTPIMQPEDWVMDKMMQFNVYMGVNKETLIKEKPPSFVLLDIDQETYNSWQKGLSTILQRTPLDKLENLIEVAVRNEARLIIVDIDLFYQTMKKAPYIEELIDYLKKHADKCKRNESDCSRIILVRSISFHLKPPQENIGVFENVVTESYPYIQWGSSEWFKSNNVTRRWSLWEMVCTNGQPKVIPSIALLATSIIREKECTEDNKEKCNIRDVLDRLKPQTCNQEIAPVEPINFYNFTINPNFGSVQQRFMYRLPYETVPIYDKNDFPISTILSAQSYAKPLLKDSLEVYPSGAKPFPKKVL
ncbi:membrane protein [Beggiatoa sp. PS]|nr:membrane protein [Beggiatoa sp. PS]